MSVAGAGPELAAVGSSRDQQPGQAPIGLGVMTRAAGEPLAVPVFDGQTAAPLTGPAPVEPRSTRLGRTDVGVVGARGLVKTTGQAARATAGATSLTALLPPQVRQRRREGVVRPEGWTPPVHDGPQGSVRLVRRRREAARR